jgi:3-hydroxy-9,10-secoandrosta-1,3,5(10)-triene-9,17-dione monooxygenase
MNIEPIRNLHASIDVELERIVAAHSAADREALGPGLLDVLGSSDVVRILDEGPASGPGTVRDVLHACILLGKTDASLAWIVGVSNSAWSMRGNFRALDRAASASLERNKLAAMVLGRPGTLERSPDGQHWLLNGEWKYASGSTYASYFFCLAAVEGSAGRDVRVVAVPAGEMQVAAPWQSTGLRGTQSVTLRATKLAVLDTSVESYGRILSGDSGTGVRKRASYSSLFTGVLMNCLLGAVLGAAEGGLEIVAGVADKRPVLGSTYAQLSASGAIRAEIGRLRSALDLYRRAAEYNADVIDRAARDPGVTLTDQDRVDIRGRATQIMRGCVDVVQDLLWIYGSSGLDVGEPLERIWRDVNVGARHGGFSRLVPEEAVALAFLGRNPRDLTHMF